MKALLLVDKQSDKIEIQSIEEPTVEPGYVKVKLKAAALNHRDQWCRQGMYPGIVYNTVLGSDGCGVVVELGAGVDPLWKGKEIVINPNINWGSDPVAQAADYTILGMPSNGTLAEYIVVQEDRLYEKPQHLDATAAAALPLGGLTAFRAVFTKGIVQKGMKVLVTGIGGGVAQFAFLFSKAAGAKVYVTSSEDRKIEKAKKAGASGGYNYKVEFWEKSALSDTEGFDVIIDSAGGNQINTYLKLVKMGGRIVHYGSTTGMPSKLDIFRLFWSQASIHGTTMGNDEEFKMMLDFVEDHKIHPIIDSIRPLNETIAAFDEMRDGKQFGKLVISMEEF